MKNYKLIVLSLAMTMTVTVGHAQNSPSGILMNIYAFTPADMLLYSQFSNSFGTARSSAMGGAFSSLGGDLATIGLNPAGIGMSRSSIWGFSPLLTVSDTKANHSRGHDTDFTRFTLNNIGTILRLSERSSGLVGFNMGLSYNKVADFNFRSGVTFPAGSKSLLHLFQLQLNRLGMIENEGWHGITKEELDGNPFDDSAIGVNEWGAVLSYLTGALTPVNGSKENYLYRVNSIADGAIITPSLEYDSRGSAGEYNISGGMNLNNIFYFGLGMAIQDIHQRQEINYSERYDYSTGASGTLLKSMDYAQSSKMTGTGVNFKFGIIARPVSGLRIGIAIHTPPMVEMNHEYVADMQTHFEHQSGKNAVSFVNIYNYNYTGPTRLMAGISYTFSNVAAISVDYEKAFYNGMRLTSGEAAIRREYRNHIKRMYRAADNVRVGIEVKPIPMLALRAGYAYQGSPFKYNDTVTTRYIPISTSAISAGLGFWLGKTTTLDLAYIFSKSKYADIPLFSYQGDGYLPDANGNGELKHGIDIAPSSLMNRISQNRHIVTMSFNFMF